MTKIENVDIFVRKRILIPIALIFVLLLVVTVLSLSWLQQRHIDSFVARQDDAIQKLFTSYMDHDVALMVSLLESYADNPELIRAFHERDRAKLFEVFNQVCSILPSDSESKHFAFLEPDGTVLYRSCVMEGQGLGERLFPFAINPEAVRPGKVFSKIVISSEGVLVLRVLYPLYRDGTLEGFVVLAKDIKPLTRVVKEVLGVELLLLAPRSVLDNAVLAISLGRANKDADRYHFTDYVLLASTLDTITVQTAEALDRAFFGTSQETFTIKTGALVYAGKLSHLVNPDKSAIAEIVLLSNITDKTASLQVLTALLSALSVGTGALLIFFFYHYTGRIQRRLSLTHQALQGEIEERIKAEQSLHEINNTLAERVEQRTLDLQKSNAELQESADRFQAVMDSLDALVYVADMESHELLFVNKFGTDTFGDICGKPCWQVLLVGQEGPCGFCSNPYLLTESGEPGPTHVWERQDPVSGDWFECRDQAIHWKDGRLVRMEIATNINQRKQAEGEKEDLQNQLLQSQKMESIGRLAGGVAHDFNNILSAINGYAEMCLMKMGEEDPLRSMVKIILESGRRAARLTQQLLAFSRKQIIRQEIIDVNKEIDDTYKMLKRLLGEDVEIEIIREQELWPVRADRSQLEQVVINLAVNARDAMPNGGSLLIETANVSLDVFKRRGHCRVADGDYVMLAITDTGHGMSAELQQHIFEPFFTTKSKDKGTGLGLATVYGVIKQNRGEILVYSEPGQGTTFKIYLPRVEGDFEENDEIPIGGDALGTRGSETILLVEDDVVVRRMTLEILAGLGYTVLEAQNGEDALRVCSRYHGKIDLLLSDVVMPKMSGPELSEKLKQLFAETKTLFMSGYTENAIVHHGVLQNGVNFIHKPISPIALAREVRRILG